MVGVQDVGVARRSQWVALFLLHYAVRCVVCSYYQMVVGDCVLGLIPSVLHLDNSTA